MACLLFTELTRNSQNIVTEKTQLSPKLNTSNRETN